MAACYERPFQLLALPPVVALAAALDHCRLYDHHSRRLNVPRKTKQIKFRSGHNHEEKKAPNLKQALVPHVGYSSPLIHRRNWLSIYLRAIHPAAFGDVSCAYSCAYRKAESKPCNMHGQLHLNYPNLVWFSVVITVRTCTMLPYCMALHFRFLGLSRWARSSVLVSGILQHVTPNHAALIIANSASHSLHRDKDCRRSIHTASFAMRSALV